MSADLSSIHLRRTEENAAGIEAATQRYGRRVGITGVVAHLDRTAARAPVPGTAVEWGFRWNDEDEATERWWPQGITTSADASGTDDVEGHRLLLASWYAKPVRGTHLGSRITVVDLDRLRYRHVLLVVPRATRAGGVELEPLRVHAGGLVWCGPHLYVAGTGRGLLCARVEDVIRVSSPKEAFGHRFVLPVRFAYQAGAGDGVEQMRYSFLSLDRGSAPPHLVAGEYGRRGMTRRLVRYPLDEATFGLAAHEDGASRPVWLDHRGRGHMQGAAVVGGTHYVTVSRGRHRLGTMYVGEPGRFRGYPRALPVGPEDLCYWPSTDLLWSLSEWPGHRFVFAVRRSRFDA